ncbi:CDP-glycerol glycerophosphotransferase family protein [Xenorhabdus thailandensis]|uniref:CDP-glycerol glycerophosphotransferase family protein n=1 Tax=Xenorhabdus thailandensis TaxID=3136255 RepID=UPI0030F49611
MKFYNVFTVLSKFVIALIIYPFYKTIKLRNIKSIIIVGTRNGESGYITFRFDRYSVLNNTKENIESCFIMFTWRKILSLNHSNIIIEIIKKISSIKNDINIYICSHEHSNITNIEFFCSKKVIFISINEIQKTISNTDLFITDYSSISWDYLYQNKQVCFIQYDYDIYTKYEGVYFDKADFFGYFLNDVNEIGDDFFRNVYNFNNIRNKEFLLKYPFYGQGEKKHSEKLELLTRNIK